MENVLAWLITVCEWVGLGRFIIGAILTVVTYWVGTWISEKWGFDPEPWWSLICWGIVAVCVVGVAVNVAT